jgi:two-component system KDP operon response regulator KdpE
MSPEHFHVLVAADEQSLRRSLVDSLTAAGFSLEEVSSGTEATEVILHRRVDLVLLSLNLPDGRGIENCRKLRALAPDLGIVMIRANGTPADEIPALDAGADDCVAAPFRFREIVARLGAVLRRGQVESAPKAPVLRAGNIQLDVERRQFRLAGRQVHLSPREFDLLLFLMKNQNVTLTHLKLLRGVWGSDSGLDSGYLRSYIKALRKKIENDPAKPGYILTVPWVGYRFHNPDGSPDSSL